jgi:hypothetical protein
MIATAKHANASREPGQTASSKDQGAPMNSHQKAVAHDDFCMASMAVDDARKTSTDRLLVRLAAIRICRDVGMSLRRALNAVDCVLEADSVRFVSHARPKR